VRSRRSTGIISPPNADSLAGFLESLAACLPSIACSEIGGKCCTCAAFTLDTRHRAHRSQAIARPSCWRQRPNTRNPRRRFWRCDGTLLGLREPAMKPRSFTGTARHLRQHAKPLHRLALADIDRRAIAERLGRLRRSHHRTLNGTDLRPAMSGGFASWENLTLAAIVALWFGLWLVA
jgi:hypothetical protein